MAKLVYDQDGRLLFTKEMAKEYTVLMPQMLPIHFSMLRMCLEMEGLTVEQLNTNHRGIARNGLKYVHNDTCYPALLVIGQFIDAIESGKYDPDKVALFITQTGGGCRASNYIHLLRKALKKAGYEQVPVISVNLSGLEKNPGFQMNLTLIRRLVFALIYGDLIMLLANQCRPYEIVAGSTDDKVKFWVNYLVNEFKDSGTLNYKHVVRNMDRIAADFNELPVNLTPKIRVGVVGEIYIKYSSLGNNNLEEFLLSEGCEPVVPGITDFILMKIDNRVVDSDIYGGKKAVKIGASILQKYVLKIQAAMIHTVRRYPRFRAPSNFAHLKGLVKEYVGYGNKMGEGWLLTGEMLELIADGTPNIVCTQPFGCLPNHIVGKGMIRKIHENNPQANIVAIDYDPGATKINQENRIKLMLANARMNAEKQAQKQQQAASGGKQPAEASKG